ncbi:polysaccharide pyruvyl transferase family protein [Agromyces agglutinans]|nr:polysaccharide pyruvyl transferase family protein [Agromyces agglutinans]
MLAFITSLRHPQNSSDYGRVELLLQWTLRSIANQTSGEYLVFVVANQVPSFELPERVHFVEVDFPSPAPNGGRHTAREAVLWDKGTKLAVGLIAAAGYDPEYVMIFDSDDFIHRDVVKFADANPGRPGWYISDGWRYSRATNAYRPLRGFNDECGTSYILPFAVYAVPAHASVNDTQEQLADAFGDRLLEIIGSHLHLVEWLAARGHVIEKLPIRGAVHHVDTGENHSRITIRGLARPYSRRLLREYAIAPSRSRAQTWWSAIGPRALINLPRDLGFRAYKSAVKTKRALRSRRGALRLTLDRLTIPIEGVLERLALRGRAWRRRVVDSGDRALLIVGPGAGSIGDEAMYQSFLLNSPLPVSVIARNANDLARPPAELRARFSPLPNLLYGGVISRMRALADFRRMLESASSVSVVGADVVDGKYNPKASVRRFRTAGVAARMGIPAQILGFSWNEAPDPAALRAVRKVPPAVRLLARDPISAERLIRSGASNVRAAADLAFLTKPSADLPSTIEAWLRGQRGRRIVIVNSNPRLAGSFPDQMAEYCYLVRCLVARGESCVLLPHDSRDLGRGSEIAHLRRLADEIRPSPHVLSLPETLEPGEVVRLAQYASLTISGRMHLAILSAVAGVPTVGLDYQGKFEGLYRLLDIADLRVPQGELDGRLVESVERALAQLESYSGSLRRALPDVIRLAERNFEMLNEN